MRKFSLLLGCLLYISLNSFSQETIGLPEILNFRSNDYHAATGVFQIAQDREGIIYMANNDGLLTYNGNYWHTYTMPGKTPIKSLAIDSSGKIYVGGQDELGYFYPNKNGILTYYSIKQLVPPAEHQFADILSIVIHKNGIFFRSVETIFCLKNNKIQTFDAAAGWLFLGSKGDQLFAVDKIEGLLMLSGTHWVPACTNMKTHRLHINSINDYSNQSLLVSTPKDGSYLLKNHLLTPLKNNPGQIIDNETFNCTEKIGFNQYAAGTSSNGLVIIDSTGKIKEQFSTPQGLQNAAVHSIFQDRDKNLWLGLENGTTIVNYHSSIKHIYPVKGNQPPTNSALIVNNRLYLGTSNGVYATGIDFSLPDLSLSPASFNEVQNTGGQVFTLTDIANQVISGQENGAFIVSGQKATPITPNQGIWTIKQIQKSTIILAGTYTGLELFSLGVGKITDQGKVKGLFESLNNLAFDRKGNIWASHPYRGIFELRLSEDNKQLIYKKQYTVREGLPDNSFNKIYYLRGKLLAATTRGIYEYDEHTDRFKEAAFFKTIFQKISIQALVEDKSGNIWFSTDAGPGVIDFSKPSKNQTWSVIYFPELQGKLVKGAEFIYPYNNENIFIGSNSGMFHLNYAHYIQNSIAPVVILGAVIAISDKDSLLFGGYFPKKNINHAFSENLGVRRLSNRWNSFHFEFASISFTSQNSFEFSYKLVGFDRTWSSWSLKTVKDYTNLAAGTYTFSVRVRNNFGLISLPARYTFTIMPAWYQSLGALIFYIILGMYLLASIIRWQENRFKKQQQKYILEKERQRYLHSLELDKTENALISLQKASLEDELQFKNKELASLMMHMVERGGVLLNIKQALIEIIKKPNITDTAHEFRAVFRILDDSEKSRDDWNNFSVYFDKVHNNFLTVLKTRFPGLSSTDLKLCAYLRLNLSSKEIAQLLNISLKGVEISRYRIRKKMQLNTEVNLYDFLMNIKQHEN